MPTELECNTRNLIKSTVEFYENSLGEIPTGITLAELDEIQNTHDIEIRGALLQFLCYAGANYHSLFHGSTDSMSLEADIQDFIQFACEETPGMEDYFPRDAFVISGKDTDIVFLRKSEMRLNNDPPVYYWEATKWYELRRDVTVQIAPSFSSYLDSAAEYSKRYYRK